MEMSSHSDFVIRDMCASDCQAIGLLHLRALPDDFLPSLGLDFLAKTYYPACLRSPFNHIKVAEDGGTIVGFVNISIEPEKQFAWIVVREWKAVFARALGLLFRPSQLRSALEIVVRRTPSFEKSGEVVFIAVEPTRHGEGIGKRLVNAVNSFLRERGVGKAFTKTLSTNQHVIRMYETYGGLVNSRMCIHKKEYVFIQWPTFSLVSIL